jgi:hypothetical protein
MEADMLTLRRHALVSLVGVSLAVSACARAAAPARPSPASDVSLSIRFDNHAREHVHVYLIGEKREWLLGRVEPGAIATLPIPEEPLAGNPTFMRLVVIAGEGITLDAARHVRAMPTLAQPMSALLSQQWKYSQGLLTSLGR